MLHIQQHLLGKALAQPAVDLGDLLFIEIDTGGGGTLDILPARLLEALAGTEGDALEVVAVVVEAGKDRPGDFDSGPGRGACEDRRCRGEIQSLVCLSGIRRLYRPLRG
ncbi:hypothetical protein PPS11_24343 [Pseudomonas putida S11]|nr:hypothetical protein PPS11_24343 [Pseudomonas putida S11]